MELNAAFFVVLKSANKYVFVKRGIMTLLLEWSGTFI